MARFFWHVWGTQAIASWTRTHHTKTRRHPIGKSNVLEINGFYFAR